MIVVDNVVAGYRTARGFVTAIDHVSLEVRHNEILGIAGESGCGKTTLLKLLYGRFDDGLEIVSGRVFWRSHDGTEEIECADFHRHWWDLFTYVPQGADEHAQPADARLNRRCSDADQRKPGRAGDAPPTRARHDEGTRPSRPDPQASYPHQLSGACGSAS